MATNVSVHTLGEDRFEDWNVLVRASPEGTIYSTPEYLDTLCVAAGGGFSIAGVEFGDQLVGGIALYERSTGYGVYASPRLLLYYQSPVLAPFETKYPSQRTARHLKILGALTEALEARGYGRAELRCRPTIQDVRPFIQAGWKVCPGYTYVVPIGNVDAAYERIEQNLRRLIRRCEKAGVLFVEDDDFESFYRLHALTMGRKETGRYLARDTFGRFFETLRGRGLCRLYHARLPDGRSIASQLVLLGPGPHAHTVTAGADPEHLKTGASAFLRWKVFDALSGLGYEGNDLTDASLNPVTHFKGQLGGDLTTTLVLESPLSTRWRFGSRAERLYHGARSAVGRGVRALRRTPT